MIDTGYLFSREDKRIFVNTCLGCTGLSTKKRNNYKEARQFEDLIEYLGQLVIFVSSATISQWNKIEKGTDSLNKRFNTFEISN